MWPSLTTSESCRSSSCSGPCSLHRTCPSPHHMNTELMHTRQVHAHVLTTPLRHNPDACTCRVTVKLGGRYDMGPHVPPASEGWVASTYGKDFCIWEKQK
jgi:hypothetical protein